MENKLQQLTDKLYNEGLSRGQEQGQTILAEAQAQAASIIAAAKAQALEIAAKAEKEAAELRTNTEREIRLASAQTLSTLRQQISKMVTAEVVTPVVSAAWQDGKFVKDLILNAVTTFNPSSQQPIQLVVPESMISEISSVIAAKFAQGVNVTTDSRVKVPFRIAPESGGYYISFTDADFDAMMHTSIRPRIAELLFSEK